MRPSTGDFPSDEADFSAAPSDFSSPIIDCPHRDNRIHSAARALPVALDVLPACVADFYRTMGLCQRNGRHLIAPVSKIRRLVPEFRVVGPRFQHCTTQKPLTARRFAIAGFE